jgi:hypothetical protein
MFPNNIAEFGYAMECEGDLPSRRGKINRAIKMLINSLDPNEEQYQIFRECGIEINSLTEDEIDYIESEVAEFS